MTEKQRFIYRAVKDEDHPYFVLSRAVAQDSNLTFEARGVLIYILSKPDHWKVQPKDLEQQCKKSVVYRILKELIKARYIERSQTRDSNHKIISWNYAVHENPLPKKQEVAFQEVEKQEVENQHIREYRGLESTDSKKIEIEEKESTSPIKLDMDAAQEAAAYVDTVIKKLETGEMQIVANNEPAKEPEYTESQRIARLIEAYLKATKSVKETMYGNKTVRAEAKKLDGYGIQPGHIRLFIDRLSKQDFWRGKSISWSYVCGNIVKHFEEFPVPKITVPDVEPVVVLNNEPVEDIELTEDDFDRLLEAAANARKV